MAPSNRRSIRKPSVPKFLSIVPSSFKSTLTFFDHVSMTAGAGVFITYAFRANSCRDPWAAVGGGSPTGFTELSNLYTHYRVESVEVEYNGYNATNVYSIVGLTWRAGNVAAPTTGVEAQQVLTEVPERSTWAQAYPASVNWPNTIVVKTARRIDQILRTATDADLQCAFDTEPTTQAYVDLTCVSVDGSAVGTQLHGTITLKYHLVCFDPNCAITD